MKKATDELRACLLDELDLPKCLELARFTFMPRGVVEEGGTDPGVTIRTAFGMHSGSFVLGTRDSRVAVEGVFDIDAGQGGGGVGRGKGDGGAVGGGAAVGDGVGGGDRDRAAVHDENAGGADGNRGVVGAHATSGGGTSSVHPGDDVYGGGMIGYHDPYDDYGGDGDPFYTFVGADYDEARRGGGGGRNVGTGGHGHPGHRAGGGVGGGDTDYDHGSLGSRGNSHSGLCGLSGGGGRNSVRTVQDEVLVDTFEALRVEKEPPPTCEMGGT